MPTIAPTFETLEISLSPTGVAELTFNRPTRYNALSPQSYKDWLHALEWAAECKEVKVVVITGRGKYYTSGQELQVPDLSAPTEVAKGVQRLQTTSKLVATMIRFPKLLIAAVNGHAIGFGVTTLALCDIVYSVPEATFTTPFMKLGFCAEGCSSVLLPRIMGPSKANEMLMLGRTFGAEELAQCGLLSRLIPLEGFRETVLAQAEQAARFSAEAMMTTKDLVRCVDKDLLLKVNEKEMVVLGERMRSADSIESIRLFKEEAKKRKASKL